MQYEKGPVDHFDDNCELSIFSLTFMKITLNITYYKLTFISQKYIAHVNLSETIVFTDQQSEHSTQKVLSLTTVLLYDSIVVVNSLNLIMSLLD